LLTFRNIALAFRAELLRVFDIDPSEVANATLLFDIKDGHRLVDPLGQDFKNDEAAIAKAKVIAIGVSLDKPAVDPERRIAVLNESREQIFSVPVYSKPSMSIT
jgi:hypothetical protein